jgi:hypothetical protein
MLDERLFGGSDQIDAVNILGAHGSIQRANRIAAGSAILINHGLTIDFRRECAPVRNSPVSGDRENRYDRVPDREGPHQMS